MNDEKPVQSNPTPPNIFPGVPPSKLPVKSALNKQKVFAISITILSIITLILVVISLIAISQKADQNTQNNRTNEIEKRLEAIEKENEYSERQVDRDSNQAVFLNSGQVYFGKLTEINKDTMKLEDIYYLKTGSVDKSGNVKAGQDVSLIKLGAELHGPEDVMYIERKNVSFWENLKNESQVSRAIAEYKRN